MRLGSDEYSDLFFTCSLIEFIGRETKNKRKDVVHKLGRDNIERILTHACVLHCEPIAAVAYEYSRICGITEGQFDNVGNCIYDVPDYWDIGDVFARAIEDMSDGTDIVSDLFTVYDSWLTDALSEFNSFLFFQPREYIHACFVKGDYIED